MKKFLILFLTAALVASALVCFPFTVSAENSGYELIKNGDIESDIEGVWKYYWPGTSVVTATEQGRTGKGLSVTSRTDKTGTICQDVSQMLSYYGAGTYEVSAYIKIANAESVTADFMLVVNYGTVEGENYWATTEFATVNTSDWTEVKGQIDINYNGTLNKADFYLIGGDGQAYYDMLIDDCSMKTVSYTGDAYSVAYELIDNGEIDADIEGTWKYYWPGTSIVAATEQGRTGKGLSVTHRTDKTGTICQDVSKKLSYYGSGTYEVSAYIKLANAEAVTADFMLVVNYGTAEGENYWATTEFTTVNTTDWTEVKGQIDINYSGTLNKADFYLIGGDGQEYYDMLIDDCSMKTVTYTGDAYVESETPDAPVEPEEPEISYELLDNADFETLPGFTWLPYVGCFVDWVEGGRNGMCISICDRTDYTDITHQAVTNKLNYYGPGTYEISAWVKLADENASAIGINVVVATTDANGNMSWPQTNYISVNGTDWTEVKARVDITWDGTLSNADFYIISDENREVGVYQNLLIDDCSFRTISYIGDAYATETPTDPVEPDTDPVEPDTDPVEPDTEPVTEPTDIPTEPTTGAPTEPTTDTSDEPVATSPVENTTTGSSDTDVVESGCSSVLGFGTISIIALAAYCVMKKKD
ncbi:MAG: carbohydrate binding domain-containing protein [Clostridia bacterium]|nr:carbohydrate binding domain-containing protein [Clostridia bacterium]